MLDYYPGAGVASAVGDHFVLWHPVDGGRDWYSGALPGYDKGRDEG